MSAIDRIIHDPLLTGHQLLQPLMSTIDQLKIEGEELRNRVGNRLFSLISLSKTAKSVVKIISLIALGIITAPIIALLFVTGCLVKLAALALNFGVSSEKRALIVQKLQPNEVNRATVCKVARQWEKLATEKYFRTNQVQFRDCDNISHHIARCMESEDPCKPCKQIYICRDKALQEPQAIAMTNEFEGYNKASSRKEKYLEISYIVTNPKNVRSAVNSKEYARVEGAGTALISQIGKNVLQNSQMEGIYLDAVDSAVPFYKKLGFERLDRNVLSRTPSRLTPMRLTKDKISQLNKKVGV